MSEIIHGILYSPESDYAAMRCILAGLSCYAIIGVGMSLARRFK